MWLVFGAHTMFLLDSTSLGMCPWTHQALVIGSLGISSTTKALPLTSSVWPGAWHGIYIKRPPMRQTFIRAHRWSEIGPGIMAVGKGTGKWQVKKCSGDPFGFFWIIPEHFCLENAPQWKTDSHSLNLLCNQRSGLSQSDTHRSASDVETANVTSWNPWGWGCQHQFSAALRQRVGINGCIVPAVVILPRRWPGCLYQASLWWNWWHCSSLHNL